MMIMTWLILITLINISMTMEIMLKSKNHHIKEALEVKDGKMVLNSHHSITNMITFMLHHKWENHLSLKIETILMIWLTHTIQTNMKTIMEIMPNITQPSLEIMHKLMDQNKIKKQLKKLPIKLHWQQIIREVSEAKDGKMDLNFLHSITNTMSHLKWENH